MLKLILLLMLPGFLAGYVSEDIKGKTKAEYGKWIANSFFCTCLLFLADCSFLYFFFREEYGRFLEFISRRMEAVEDVFLLAVLWLVQLAIALILGLLLRIWKYGGIEKASRMMSAVKRKRIFSVCTMSLAAVIAVAVVKDYAENRLVINEVCGENYGITADEEGNYGDYVELYNPSVWNVRLNGFSLSDSSEEQGKKLTTEVLVPAKGHYVVWTKSGEDGFGIASSGEELYFLSPSGKVKDSVKIPELRNNTVYARTNDGEKEWKEELPTPMQENDRNKVYVETPVFSAEGGFYDNEFLLSLSAAKGNQIYYTLDGSVPDETAMLYSKQIPVKNVCGTPNVYRAIRNVTEDWKNYTPPTEPVDKAFIVRAMAMDSYGNKSEVVTKTYFVDMNRYKDRYVLSMVSDPEELFGDEGIYVTGKRYDDWYEGRTTEEHPERLPIFMQRGREYEIETSLELFKDELLMSQPAGLRIQGASWRKVPLKRFSLFSRKEYSGDRYFTYNLFGKKMHSFFMRPDFEDVLVQSLLEDRNLGTLKAVPATVFLDGEYWYDTFLREKYSEDYLAERYGVERNDVTLAELTPDELYEFIYSHDLSVEEDYRQFEEMVDIQNYIDYMSANIYLANMDGSEGKNCRMWKTTGRGSTEYDDGRWRWLIYDMDSITWNRVEYYQAERYAIDSFSHEKEFAGVAYNQSELYKALRVNEQFCKQFVLTFMDMANTNFAEKNVAGKLALWGKDMSWNGGFFEKRFDAIVPCLAKEFELEGTLEELILSVNDENAGYVTVNTVTPVLQDGSWTGKYYTDYPVTVTAVAKDGYEFVGWRSESAENDMEQMEVWLSTGENSWEAVFQPIGGEK